MNYEKARNVFGGMPPLRHSIPGQPFAWSRSEVVAWLLARPETAAHLFSMASEAKAIVYDKATGKWVGRDWRDG